MFSGIVEEVGRLTSASSKGLVISASKVLQETEPGASIAVNGVCLTVTGLDDRSVSVDVMPETLKLSNLGRLKRGDEVNLERSLALGDRIGGHLVQGHVDATGRVALVRQEDGAVLLEIETPPELMRYIVAKGFIAVDGISLTVVARSSSSFQVSIVEFSLKHSNLGRRRAGDAVNLEVDVIAKYVEQLTGAKSSAITLGFLQEHGFMVT
ncbi:MAG: riboflavin synthase [Dehalococcoidales bacterium]